MSEMSIDPEGVADVDRNSFLAITAGFLAAIGLLSVIEPALLFLSAIAVILGLAVVVFAKRWQITRLSRGVAAVAVIGGAFSLGAGLTQRAYWNSYHASKAISLAESYMDALARGDRDLAIKLVGLSQMVADAGPDNEMSREQKAVRLFLADDLIQEVIKRGGLAQWKSTGVLSSEKVGDVVESKIGFIDRTIVNQVPLVISIKMLPPQKYSPDTTTRWVVGSIDREGDSY